MDFQSSKRIVLDHYSRIDGATSSTISDILSIGVSSNWLWRGFHPFGELRGVSSVTDQFWRPFLDSFGSVRRRQDIFFAGKNEIVSDSDNSVWVVSMGHLLGLFDSPFLGIPPTHKLAMFRYCEFNRVESGEIVETTFYFDLPHLMVQAGLVPFPTQTGIHLVHPGPMSHSGLRYDISDPSESSKTSLLLNKMIADLGTWQNDLSLEDELGRTWHDDMLWWGPEGIGSTYTISRYADQHSAPFRAAFSDRSSTSHLCRLSEDSYAGFFGFPNFTASHTGNFIGKSATGICTEFRVIDIYRRDGDKLAENWVFIDLLHWLHQLGDDVLGRL